MRSHGRYNPAVDLQPVSQTGFIDLCDAIVSGVVPSQLPDSEEVYNGIEDPESILGKPSDVFEALRMESYIKSVGTSEPSKDEPANG